MSFRMQLLLGGACAVVAIVALIARASLDDWDQQCLPGLMLLILFLVCGGVALILLGCLQHKHEMTHPTHQSGSVLIVLNPVGGLMTLWGIAAFVAIPFVVYYFCSPKSRSIRKGIHLARLAEELGKPDHDLVDTAGFLAPRQADFSHTAFSDPHCSCLEDASTLEKIKLDGTQITDEGLRHLRGLSALRELSLSDTAITDAGLESLITLPALEEVDLDGTQVTLAGLKMLLRHPTLRSVGPLDLESVRFAIDNIGPAAIEHAKTLLASDDLWALECLFRSCDCFQKDGRFDAPQFSAALQHVSEAIILKAVMLFREENESSEYARSRALYSILQGSALFLDEEGRFDAAAFDAAFNRISRQQFADVVKKTGDGTEAFKFLFCAFAEDIDPVAERQMTVELAEKATLELILIRGGIFLMGSRAGERDEKPVHRVKITKAFYLGKYEVTQEQWKAVMGSDPSYFKGPKKPVESVSWDDCQGFLKKLNEIVGKRVGTFRLPREAEWEYACCAGSFAEYCFGSGPGLDDYAWYGSEETHSVGQKKSNAWGLYDMHGNVAEWCDDWYGDYRWHKDYPLYRDYRSEMVDDPTGPSDGRYSGRVNRGGSWSNIASGCRSARRSYNPPGYCDRFLGFRVCLVPAEE